MRKGIFFLFCALNPILHFAANIDGIFYLEDEGPKRPMPISNGRDALRNEMQHERDLEEKRQRIDNGESIDLTPQGKNFYEKIGPGFKDEDCFNKRRTRFARDNQEEFDKQFTLEQHVYFYLASGECEPDYQ